MVPGGEFQLVGEFYVGVKDGVPIVRSGSDSEGDAKSVEIYPEADDALSRFYNVRRCRLYIEPTPVRAPESWGDING